MCACAHSGCDETRREKKERRWGGFVLCCGVVDDDPSMEDFLGGIGASRVDTGIPGHRFTHRHHSPAPAPRLLFSLLFFRSFSLSYAFLFLFFSQRAAVSKTMSDRYLGEWMHGINNGMKQPSYPWVLKLYYRSNIVFGGCVKVRGFLYTRVIIWVNTYSTSYWYQGDSTYVWKLLHDIQTWMVSKRIMLSNTHTMLVSKVWNLHHRYPNGIKKKYITSPTLVQTTSTTLNIVLKGGSDGVPTLNTSHATILTWNNQDMASSGS